MLQAIHILMKDTRYLWRELCLFFGLAALFAWKTGEHFAWVQVLLGVTAAYLIARVVHAEPIPGKHSILDHASVSMAQSSGGEDFLRLTIRQFAYLFGARCPHPS